MLFNSVHFLIFFPIVVLIYFVVPKKLRYIWLLVASYYFYMSWFPKWAVLLLFSTVVTYVSGLLLEWIKRRKWDDRRKIRWKKRCVFGSFGANLGVLALFKYSNFLIDNVNSFLELLHIEVLDLSFGLALPVGISFYTFQALGYTMDVYRDEIYAEKNFLKYALFVSFFPQLVAGPIERSKNLLKQINTEHSFCGESVKEGLVLMLWGYFLKMVVADRISLFVDCVYGNYQRFGGWFLILASVLFAFQIYCDFAGYSVIAMGAARVMGFRLMDNFDCPYFSRSVAEFWRRWHISLSSWFKDYLYIPLGGGRKGKLRRYGNIMIVFAVSGLWHGADWTYVIWGMLNGAFQIIGSVTGKIRSAAKGKLGLKPESFGHKAVQTAVTFCLVDFAWIFFRAETLADAASVIKSMVTVRNPWIFLDGTLYEAGLDCRNFWLMVICIGILLAADWFKYHGIQLRRALMRQELWFQWCAYIGGILFVLIFGIWGSAYSAGSFIYFQF